MKVPSVPSDFKAHLSICKRRQEGDRVEDFFDPLAGCALPGHLHSGMSQETLLGDLILRSANLQEGCGQGFLMSKS